MVSMETAIENQEIYVAQCRERIEWATEYSDRIGYYEAMVVLKGAEDTLERMYDQRVSEGISFL